MKLTVENPLEMKVGESYEQLLIEFGWIVEAISVADNREEVKENLRSMERNNQIDNFYYGFGSSHLWVHQLSLVGGEGKRVIYCEL